MVAAGRLPGPIAGRDEAATASGTQEAGGEGEDGSVAGTQATLAAGSGTLPTPPWPHWAGGSGLPHRPRGLNHQAASGNSEHTDMAAMRSVMATEAVYDAVDDLAQALNVHQTTFTPWQR